MPYGILIILGLIFLVVTAVVKVVAVLLMPMGAILGVGVLAYITYQIYAYMYFKSDAFLNIKNSIDKHISNCNELNKHIEELKHSYSDMKSYDYGDSHLYDNSNYKFNRREWGKSIRSSQVHNCSSSVCKNASEQPFKYLCKYFDIKTSEETLSDFESVLNNFAAAEQGKILLQKERDAVLASVSNSMPSLILSFSKERLVRELGFNSIDFSDLYFPVYTFQYVSAGGNSSSKCDIKLNVENLDKFVGYLSGLVKFRKSVAGQRALMTSVLREKIKSRDNYTCQYCSLSVKDENNLLLEIDHVIPLSKGGITSEENLQTLCWRCNRSKGSKVIENSRSA